MRRGNLILSMQLRHAIYQELTVIGVLTFRDPVVGTQASTLPSRPRFYSLPTHPHLQTRWSSPLCTDAGGDAGRWEWAGRDNMRMTDKTANYSERRRSFPDAGLRISRDGPRMTTCSPPTSGWMVGAREYKAGHMVERHTKDSYYVWPQNICVGGIIHIIPLSAGCYPDLSYTIGRCGITSLLRTYVRNKVTRVSHVP